VSGARLAEAALALVGTRFRLHGRDPVHGLDCIGLLEAAMARIGKPITLPQGYGLRNASLDRWLPQPEALGFVPASGPMRSGDVLLSAPGPAQYHLAIAAPPHGFAHAHAGLRRVVVSAQMPAGPILQHWRLLQESD
jgi:cell wall-associated NlpC family hydrolase